jgi:hypothetical protein
MMNVFAEEILLTLLRGWREEYSIITVGDRWLRVAPFNFVFVRFAD